MEFGWRRDVLRIDHRGEFSIVGLILYIITALHGALAGICWMLLITNHR